MKLLIEGQEAKLFNISNPMTQAQVIFSLCHGMASLYIFSKQENISESKSTAPSCNALISFLIRLRNLFSSIS